MQRSEPKLKEFIRQHQPPIFRKHRWITKESTILNAVLDDSFFGFLEVDIHVPQHLHDYFQEMPPLFCNTEVKFEDMGAFMQQYVREHHMSDKPRRLLLSGMKAEKIMLSSPYLKWLLQKGLTVTKLHQVVEYSPQRCFRQFVRDVSDARRAGDVDKAQKIIADTMKLIGNSGYGTLIMDKEKHQDTLYAEGWGAAQLNINDPRLKKCALVTDNLYEMEMAKTKIRFDLPIQLGYHILQLAKLWMLQFPYDCLQEYCDVNDFEYIEMDTDSAYLSLAGKQLEDIVKPSKKQELHYEKMGQCHDFDYSSEDGFFPRECCQKHKAYNKRTPGLFKVEAHGKAMIALCSKTYILKKHDDKVKFSSKGHESLMDILWLIWNRPLQKGWGYEVIFSPVINRKSMWNIYKTWWENKRSLDVETSKSAHRNDVSCEAASTPSSGLSQSSSSRMQSDFAWSRQGPCSVPVRVCFEHSQRQRDIEA